MINELWTLSCDSMLLLMGNLVHGDFDKDCRRYLPVIVSYQGKEMCGRKSGLGYRRIKKKVSVTYASDSCFKGARPALRTPTASLHVLTMQSYRQTARYPSIDLKTS